MKQSLNIATTSNSNVSQSKAVQRTTILESSNLKFLRQIFLAQDGVMIARNGSSVFFPLTSLLQAAYTADPSLTYPPIINIQPTSSTVTAPAAAYFMISASAETPLTYKWYCQTGSANLIHTVQSDISASRFTGSLSPALTASSTTGMNGYLLQCIVSGSGINATTSSLITLTVS